MKIAVIGAGMAGVAAAQALASDGHDVTVIERRSSVAEETSFAPAGIAASGLAAPWLPAPGRLQAMAGSADEASRLRGTGAAFATPTLFGKGDGPDAGRRAERALALHKLLATGVERIDALAHALSLDFERGDGLLLALPDAATAAQAEVAVAWLQQAGETVEWADAARRVPAQRAHGQHARVDSIAARPRATPGRALPVPARGRLDLRGPEADRELRRGQRARARRDLRRRRRLCGARIVAAAGGPGREAAVETDPRLFGDGGAARARDRARLGPARRAAGRAHGHLDQPARHPRARGRRP